MSCCFLILLVFVFNPSLFRYNQAVAMTRFYKRPILLIEFDPNKSFSLQVGVPQGAQCYSTQFFLQSLNCILPLVEMDSTLCWACWNKTLQDVLHYATSCANSLYIATCIATQVARYATCFRHFTEDIFLCVKMCSLHSTEAAKWTVTQATQSHKELP